MGFEPTGKSSPCKSQARAKFQRPPRHPPRGFGADPARIATAVCDLCNHCHRHSRLSEHLPNPNHTLRAAFVIDDCMAPNYGIPDDVLLAIFSILDVRDLVSCRQVRHGPSRPFFAISHPWPFLGLLAVLLCHRVSSLLAIQDDRGLQRPRRAIHIQHDAGPFRTNNRHSKT